MLAAGRQQLASELIQFLKGAGARPRAVVIVGEAGIGKSLLLDLLQVDVLASGTHAVIAIDDAQNVDAARIDAIREQLASDTRLRLLIAGTQIPEALAQVIDSRCDRRLTELAGVSEDEARSILAEVGVQPWTIHAAQAINDAGGVPRTLIDAAFGSADLDRVVAQDASFDASSWTPAAARRLELALRDEPQALEQHIARQRTIVDDAPDSVTADERADAHAVLAEIALLDHDLELAVQHGESAAADMSAAEHVRWWAAAVAGAARAVRGEPTAMLSLHALAGRASRAGLANMESSIWNLIARCACVLGDVASARRAAIRSIMIADRVGSTALGLRGRFVLADLHLAALEPAPALAYLEEIADVAELSGLHLLQIDSIAGEARARIQLGDAEGACRAADTALELVLRRDVARAVIIEVAVVAARAHAAAGSVDLALAALGTLDASSSTSDSPDFWLMLEAIRVIAAGTDRSQLATWLERLATCDVDGHGGALRAAHAEADAWRAHAEGRRAEATRLAERARQLWVTAECHDELPLTEQLVQTSGTEQGPGISILGGAPTTPQSDPAAFDVLTKREREIARYVAGGLTNPEIASELHLSPRTVEHHVASILRKLELPSRRELVRGRV